jgi:hypothetical protein
MRAAVAAAVALTAVGCSAGMTGEARTAGDIADCQADDFAKGNVVFFGFNDNLGPGTVMKRYPGGGIGPQVLMDTLVPGRAGTVVHRGVDWTCALGDSVAQEFSDNRAIGMLPVDPDVNAKLARASHLAVTVDSVRWDDLLEGPFRAVVDQLSDQALKADLLSGRYLVVSRGFAARGIKVTALYDRSAGASVKAALGDGRRTLTQGKVSAVVNLTWESTTKLVITTPSDVYIAGQLRRLGAGSSPGGGATVAPIDPRATVLVRSGG